MLDNGPEVELGSTVASTCRKFKYSALFNVHFGNTQAPKKRIRVTSQTTTLSCGQLTRFDDFARSVFEIVDLPTERNVDLRCQPCG